MPKSSIKCANKATNTSLDIIWTQCGVTWPMSTFLAAILDFTKNAPFDLKHLLVKRRGNFDEIFGFQAPLAAILTRKYWSEGANISTKNVWETKIYHYEQKTEKKFLRAAILDFMKNAPFDLKHLLVKRRGNFDEIFGFWAPLAAILLTEGANISTKNVWGTKIYHYEWKTEKKFWGWPWILWEMLLLTWNTFWWRDEAISVKILGSMAAILPNAKLLIFEHQWQPLYLIPNTTLLVNILTNIFPISTSIQRDQLRIRNLVLNSISTTFWKPHPRKFLLSFPPMSSYLWDQYLCQEPTGESEEIPLPPPLGFYCHESVNWPIGSVLSDVFSLNQTNQNHPGPLGWSRWTTWFLIGPARRILRLSSYIVFSLVLARVGRIWSTWTNLEYTNVFFTAITFPFRDIFVHSISWPGPRVLSKFYPHSGHTTLLR